MVAVEAQVQQGGVSPRARARTHFVGERFSCSDLGSQLSERSLPVGNAPGLDEASGSGANIASNDLLPRDWLDPDGLEEPSLSMADDDHDIIDETDSETDYVAAMLPVVAVQPVTDVAVQPAASEARESTRRVREPTRQRTTTRKPPPRPPPKPCNPAWWLICFSCSVALIALVGCALWISIGYNDGLRPPSMPPPSPPPPLPSPPVT